MCAPPYMRVRNVGSVWALNAVQLRAGYRQMSFRPPSGATIGLAVVAVLIAAVVILTSLALANDAPGR
jgi:hypothetical protein